VTKFIFFNNKISNFREKDYFSLLQKNTWGIYIFPSDVYYKKETSNRESLKTFPK
jgi:hypothetical protein